MSTFHTIDLTADLDMRLQELNRILEFSDLLHDVTNAKSLTFDRVGANSNTYRYIIDLDDNRRWDETMIFDIPENPTLKLNVDPGWRQTEFMPNRVVRQELIRLVNRFSLSKLKIVFH